MNRRFCLSFGTLIAVMIILHYNSNHMATNSLPSTSRATDTNLCTKLPLNAFVPNQCLHKLLPNNIDCSCLSETTFDDFHLISTAQNWSYSSYAISEEKLLDQLESNCDVLELFNPAIMRRPSKTERDFPLAFSLLSKTNAEQLLRLIAQLYRQQNFICIAVDGKSTKMFQKIVRKLADCYNNVFMPEVMHDIYWGHYSILQAMMSCLDILRQHKWKYVQTISGSDIPLRTSKEMIKILTILNGTNDLKLKKLEIRRWLYSHYLKSTMTSDEYEKLRDDNPYLRGRKKFPGWKTNYGIERVPTNNMQVVKGSFANTMTYEYVNFLFTDQNAVHFYNWLNESFIPDENYFSTIAHNDPKAPGHFPISCLEQYDLSYSTKPWISRDEAWKQSKDFCGGKFVRGNCLIGVNDLRRLKRSANLFAHKIYLSFQPAAFVCLMKELDGSEEQRMQLDTQFYGNLPTVRFSIMRDQDKRKWDCH